MIMQGCLREESFELGSSVLPHPPYSADLEKKNDYYIFCSLQKLFDLEKIL